MRGILLFLSAIAINSCLFSNSGVTCKIVNNGTNAITLSALKGFMQYSGVLEVQPNASIILQSEKGQTVGETLLIEASIDGETYSASTKYVQDFNSLIVVFNEGKSISIFDSNWNSIQANVMLSKRQ